LHDASDRRGSLRVDFELQRAAGIARGEPKGVQNPTGKLRHGPGKELVEFFLSRVCGWMDGWMDGRMKGWMTPY